jgi:1-acyl-sn-glycerol-3-phosphate acyltransferase
MKLPGLPAFGLPPLPLPGTTASAREDEWGFDPEFAERVAPWMDVLYTRWWRVRTTGLEHLPAEGPALVVANHAGTVPWDAAMMATAMRRGRRPGSAPARDPRFLVLDWAFTLPWVSVAIRRFGGVPASPDNALALLKAGHVVFAFPEGAKGVGKPYSKRYQLERFGRGGFVDVALAAGVPIVPCAIVGSEEIYPKIGEIGGVARLLRAPYVPITPTFPLLGPLGLVPLPSRWRIAFDAPIDLDGLGPAASDDRARVLALADEIRDRIQAKMHEALVDRGGAFL